MVSPTWVSFTFLMEAVRYPTSPADRLLQGSSLVGSRWPISTRPYSAPEAIIRTVWSRVRVPSITRK